MQFNSFKPNAYNQTQERETPAMELDVLKEQRRMYTNIFTLLYNSDFKGQQIPACADALKFVDSLVTQLQADIEKLEPKPVKAVEVVEAEAVNEPSATVEPTAIV